MGVIFLGSFGRTQSEHLSAAWVQKVYAHSPPSRLQGVKLWKVGVLLHSIPRHSFSIHTLGRVPTTLFSYSFSLPVASYLQSVVGITSVEKMAPWKHLTDKESEVQNSEETFPQSHTEARQPSGNSDFQSSLILPRSHLMANPTRFVGVWLTADIQLFGLLGVCT